MTVTHLRFRVVDMTTQTGGVAPPAGTADLRLLTSIDTTAGVIVIKGTTLETTPSPAAGGGLNSTVSVAVPAGGLLSGASVNVRFLLGVQEQGTFRFFVNIEALPGPPGQPEIVNTKVDRATKQPRSSGKGARRQ